jgi:hypothetical protein
MQFWYCRPKIPLTANLPANNRSSYTRRGVTEELFVICLQEVAAFGDYPF